MKLGVDETVVSRIIAGARHQCGIALDTDHLRRVAGEWQAEIAEPAIEIQHPGRRSEVQQLDGALHQHLVDRPIHLNEIGGRKSHLQIEARQSVVQRLTREPELAHRVEPAGLQEEPHAVLGRKCFEARNILLRRCLEHPQHERRAVGRHGHLDLRYLLANAEPRQHRRERRDQLTGRRGEHVTRAQLRDEGGRALPEADHHSVLLAHELRAEACAAAIAPVGPVERAQPAHRLHTGNAREGLAQLALLRRELRCRREMLEHAAATHTEVRAARRRACRGGLQHLDELGVIVLAMSPRAMKADPLPRQGSGDEGGLAAMHDPLALVREPLDLRFLRRTGRTLAASSGRRRGQAPRSSQTRRNSAKCGSFEALRLARTRASSSSCCSGES